MYYYSGMTAFIHELRNRQLAENMPDAEFAALLGVSVSMWRAVRYGAKHPGRKFLTGVARAFPDVDLRSALLFARR